MGLFQANRRFLHPKKRKKQRCCVIECVPGIVRYLLINSLENRDRPAQRRSHPLVLAVLVYLYGSRKCISHPMGVQQQSFLSSKKMTDDVQWAAGVCVEFSLYENNSFVWN